MGWEYQDLTNNSINRLFFAIFWANYHSVKTWSLLIGLCIAVSLPGQQDLRFQHFNINDGLPQNSVTCINTDRFGFLWIGTFDGLCRYDGYEFKTYRSEPGNPP